MIDLSRFENKEDLFAHLKANKSMYIAQKKSAIKHADPISYCGMTFKEDKSDITDKAKISQAELLNMDSVRVKSVINTTNLLDSHNDVHLPKIWNKTLKEQIQFYLIKEHAFNFDNILSDEVEAYVKTMSWKQLGFDWEGETQALIFDSILHKKDNPRMFERYVQGKVKNHSVGMQYVKIYLAIDSNDSDFKEEKEVWDKYLNEIINKEEAKRIGFFWAVTEAKIIEGSAVTRGSNFATPTQSVSEVKREPLENTHQEPSESLHVKNMFEEIGKNLN